MSVHERRAKIRRLFNQKRSNLLLDLIRNMDTLIYAELSVVYYMDCHFFRFFLRCLLQFTLLSPKPAYVPEPPIQSPSRPMLIILNNLTCAFFHTVSPAPSAGEQTRGYLHGGMAMDFIGQKGPSSRIHLVLLDLLIMVLQLLSLGATSSRTRARKGAEEQKPSQTSEGDGGSGSQNEQTLDHEERGQLASEHRPEDVELRNLNPAQDSGAARDDETEHSALLSPHQDGDTPGNDNDERLRTLDPRAGLPPGEGQHIIDAFTSNQAVVANLALSRIVRDELGLGPLGSASTSTARSGSVTDGGINSARLRFRLRVGNRIFGV